MATKPVTTLEPPDDNNKPEGNKVPQDTANEFAMPTEFKDDDTAQTDNSVPTAASSGLSLDQLNDIGFNDEQDEQERAKLNPPVGDWEKEDRWKFEKRTNAEDSMPGDIDSAGRTFLNFSGKPRSRSANGLDYEPMLFLRLSPDKRYKQDKPTDVDMAYKLFLKAKDLYIDLNSEKPTKLGQLVAMLEEDSYLVRTMNGDNGPVVVDIKNKRAKR